MNPGIPLGLPRPTHPTLMVFGVSRKDRSVLGKLLKAEGRVCSLGFTTGFSGGTPTSAPQATKMVSKGVDLPRCPTEAAGDRCAAFSEASGSVESLVFEDKTN